MAFFKSKAFKYGQNLVFGFGAAVVMIGAASKITHIDIMGISGNLWILVGLGVEAALFAFSGLVPPHEDYYWQKLYPGLDNYDAPMEPQIASSKKSSSSAATLDSMLDNAKIDQLSINRLGDNLKALGANVNSMTSITEAGTATDSYTKNAKAAAEALAGVKTSYAGAAEAMGKLANASEETGKYHEQVQLVTKNLAALNAVYELELQDTNTHLKAMNKFYGTLNSTLGHLEESVDDAKTYKDNMSKLATNLDSLNNVYGNMLSAMKGNA